MPINFAQNARSVSRAQARARAQIQDNLLFGIGLDAIIVQGAHGVLGDSMVESGRD